MSETTDVISMDDKQEENVLKEVVQDNGNKDKVDVIISTVSNKIEEETVLQPSPDSTTTTITTNKQQTRVVPFVFVQAPSNIKVPTSLVSVNNSISSSQIIVNSNSQFLTLNNKINISTKSNTSLSPVVLTQTANSKPQIILQKTGAPPTGQTLIPVSVATPTGTKQTFAYLGAIIKPPGGKPGENQIVVPTNHLPAGLVPAPTNQKLVLAPMTMPKLSTRLPVTCSTPSGNHPKIANIILPMSIGSQIKSNSSVINFKISNGQIQSDPKGSITVLCDNKNNENNNDVTSTTVEKKDEKNNKNLTEVVINTSNQQTHCNKLLINNNGNNKNNDKSLNDKSYELSIPDEPPSNNKCGLNYTIKFNDDMKLYKIEQNGQEVDSIKTEIEQNPPATSANMPKQEIHRKPLHEVSILKKCNLNSFERKTEPKNKFLRKSPDTKITVTTEQAQTSNNNTDYKNSNNNNNNKVTTTQEVRKVNTERRRKSQYTYLRDFDEVIVTSGNAWDDKNEKNDKNTKLDSSTFVDKLSKIQQNEEKDKQKPLEKPIDKFPKQFQSAEITFTKLNSPEDDFTEEKKNVDDFVEIEVIKQEVPQFNSEDVKDIRTALEWKDDIGTLPGSKLKFHINEYGFIEMIVGEEYDKLLSLKNNLMNDCKKEEYTENEILNCAECGCYGMPSEFVSRRYCSTTCKDSALQTYEKLCREAFIKESKAKKKKKKLGLLGKAEIKQETVKTEDSNVLSQISNSDEDNTSNDAQGSQINYPWQGKI